MVCGDDDRVGSIEVFFIVFEVFFLYSFYLVERVVDFKFCWWNKMCGSCCVYVFLIGKKIIDIYKILLIKKKNLRIKLRIVMKIYIKK